MLRVINKMTTWFRKSEIRVRLLRRLEIWFGLALWSGRRHIRSGLCSLHRRFGRRVQLAAAQ
jgi:hypothetical protein